MGLRNLMAGLKIVRRDAVLTPWRRTLSSVFLTVVAEPQGLAQGLWNMLLASTAAQLWLWLWRLRRLWLRLLGLWLDATATGHALYRTRLSGIRPAAAVVARLRQQGCGSSSSSWSKVIARTMRKNEWQ